MIDCCKNKRSKKCVRQSDKKIFKLPRKYTFNQCKSKIKGFTMRSSCAPYKNCKSNKTKRKRKKKTII